MLLPRLLIIEDDEQLYLALQSRLGNSYEIDISSNGVDGILKNNSQAYSAILLDLGLPDISGISVCRALREASATIPIIVITGDASVGVKLRLFDAGANDYLVKPFSIDELQARLRVARRSIKTNEIRIKKFSAGDLTIDMMSHSVERCGKQIYLRRKEFAILECLAQNAGNVVTRNALMDYAWNGNEQTWADTVNVHIKYLRDKIDRPFEIPLIKTVRGLGYKLDIAQEALSDSQNI